MSSGGSGSANTSTTGTANNTYTPFGALTQVGTGGHGSAFNNGFTGLLQQEFQGAGNNQNNAQAQLGSYLNGGNISANPLYQANYNTQAIPIQEQQAQAQQTLNQKMTAQNQMGSSNADYQQYLLNQNYGNLLNQANATATQNTYQDLLNGIQGAGAAQTNAMTNEYYPMQYLTQYQDALNPLIQSQLQYQQNQNSSGNQLLGTLGTVGGTVLGGPIGGAIAGQLTNMWSGGSSGGGGIQGSTDLGFNPGLYP